MTQAVSSPPSAGSSGSSGSKAPGAGLEGVVAAKSEICFIDGTAGRLVYRGYEIGDLVENCSFEEVAYLLWEGRLPNRQQLDELRGQLGNSMPLPPHVRSLIDALPKNTE